MHRVYCKYLEIIRAGVYSCYYQILMIAKMNKTVISAKIQKRKKIKVFYYHTHTKN